MFARESAMASSSWWPLPKREHLRPKAELLQERRDGCRDHMVERAGADDGGQLFDDSTEGLAELDEPFTFGRLSVNLTGDASPQNLVLFLQVFDVLGEFSVDFSNRAQQGPLRLSWVHPNQTIVRIHFNRIHGRNAFVNSEVAIRMALSIE